MKASEWTTFLTTWTREIAARRTRNPNEQRATDMGSEFLARPRNRFARPRHGSV